MKQIKQLAYSAFLSSLVPLALLSGQAVADNPGGWEFSVAPLYLWGKNIEGTSAIGGNEAPLDLDFRDDVLENLESAFALHAEARQGALSLFAEYNYAKLSPSSLASFGPIMVRADIDFRDTMWELGIAYEIIDTGGTQVEVLGGWRHMDQDIDISVGRSGDISAPVPRQSSGGDDWSHGFGGFRMATRISENWKFRARADLGYEDSNNKAGHLFATFDYRFRDWGSFFAGYRYLNTEYDNKKSGADGYATDTDQKGPLLGVNFHF